MLEVDSIAQGGRGVARANGYVVFVSGGLPGDRVRARLTRAKRDFAEAQAIELVDPSPDRIADRCLHGGQPCPGAPWQGLPYERQLEEKTKQVDAALRRLGGLAGFELEAAEPATLEWRYRNKLEYSFGERGGRLALGFHPRGNWAEVVDVEDCLLASEPNNVARNQVREWARREGIPPYERRQHAGVLRNLVVREGRRTGQLQTRLVTARASFTKPPVDLHTVVDGPGGGTDGPTGVLGEEFLTEELAGLRLRIAPAAFFQTNTETAERLYAIAAGYAGLSGRERVFDLYCGIGTIGLDPRAPGGRGLGDRGRPRGDRRRRGERAAQPDRQRPLHRGRRAPRSSAPARAGRSPRRGRRRSAPRRALEEGGSAPDRVRGAADRLRLLQPDDAGPERRAAHRGRL